MSNSNGGNGRCLCGAVRFSAGQVDHKVGACHCGMCRRWGGGPFVGVDCGSDVTFVGEDNIATFQSSEWAQRGFCKQCGSHLFYKLMANGQYIVPVGLFQGDDQFVFDHQVFIDEKPAFYSFANETENMTGAELFAKYAPGA